MAQEIERKFLPKNDSWRSDVTSSTSVVQGYLSTEKTATVRVRIQDERLGMLCIKGRGKGLTRPEFEYEIPKGEATELLLLCGSAVLEKVRHYVVFEGHTFEIDEFKGHLTSLIVIEVELKHEDEEVRLPPWVGKEISHDSRYANAKLVRNGLPK